MNRKISWAKCSKFAGMLPKIVTATNFDTRDKMRTRLSRWTQCNSNSYDSNISASISSMTARVFNLLSTNNSVLSAAYCPQSIASLQHYHGNRYQIIYTIYADNMPIKRCVTHCNMSK